MYQYNNKTKWTPNTTKEPVQTIEVLKCYNCEHLICLEKDFDKLISKGPFKCRECGIYWDFTKLETVNKQIKN